MKTRIITALFIGASVCLTPVVASAQDSGLSLGLRAAYAVPFGTSGDGAKLNALVTGAMPLQVDVDYRLNSEWRLGGYFAYGPALIADEAKQALEAAGLSEVGGHRQQALGLQVTRAFASAARFSPWVGVAGGYEWTRHGGGKLASGMETEIGRSGFTGTVSVGGDYKVSPRFAVGPFVAVDLGRYGKNLEWIEDGDSSSSDVTEKGLHEWVRVGVKLSWTF